MADTRLNILTSKMRAGTITPTESLELKTLLQAGPSSISSPDTIASSIINKPADQVVKEKAAYDEAKRLELAKEPTTIVTAKSSQLGSVPKAVTLPSKKIDAYQQDVEAARLNPATVPTESNVGKLPAFPIPEVTEVAKPQEVQDETAPVVQKDVQTTSGEEQTLIEANDVEAVKQASTEGKKSFSDTLKDLALKYGVPMLEILQAVGYQRAGINKPTVLEQKYQEALDKRTNEYLEDLNNKKLENERKFQESMLEKQQQFAANQAELNRIADKEARGEQLSGQEKLMRMQLEAEIAAKKATMATQAPSKSLIPE